jgi:hypothetical protein
MSDDELLVIIATTRFVRLPAALSLCIAMLGFQGASGTPQMEAKLRDNCGSVGSVEKFALCLLVTMSIAAVIVLSWWYTTANVAGSVTTTVDY